MRETLAWQWRAGESPSQHYSLLSDKHKGEAFGWGPSLGGRLDFWRMESDFKVWEVGEERFASVVLVRTDGYLITDYTHKVIEFVPPTPLPDTING